MVSNPGRTHAKPELSRSEKAVDWLANALIFMHICFVALVMVESNRSMKSVRSSDRSLDSHLESREFMRFGAALGLRRLCERIP